MTATQPWPAPPAPVRSRNWLTMTMAAVAVVLAAAALIVALTRSGAGSSPTYTAAERAEAKTKLCGQYKLAAQAVGVETNSTDNAALARISDTNGALILGTASADPALDNKLRIAAQDLALAYQTVVAVSSSKAIEDPQFSAAIDNSNAKDRVMQELCGD